MAVEEAVVEDVVRHGVHDSASLPPATTATCTRTPRPMRREPT